MSPAKTFKVKTKSATEKQEWITAINNYIQKSSAATGEGPSVGVADIAPLWKPDGHSPDCELCRAVFTLLFRRHHCRHCGRVVCDPCSVKRFHLPHVELRRLVRVCDRCFPLLQRQQQNTNSIRNNGSNSTTAGQSKRTVLMAHSSVRTDIASDDEGDEDFDNDETGGNEENNISDDERSRGEVDESALDDFNDWEMAQRTAGTLPIPNNHSPCSSSPGMSSSSRSENERIATLVTAPMMKLSAAMGDNIRRFARSNITVASGDDERGDVTSPIPLNFSPAQNRWIQRALPPLRSPPIATSSVALNTFSNHGYSDGVISTPASSGSNPILYPTQETKISTFSSTPPPPPIPPPPPPRRHSHLHTSNVPTHYETVNNGIDGTSQDSNDRSTLASYHVANSNNNSSNPPPKPQRVQRRTNVIIHIEPAIVAAAAARIAEEEEAS